jgi:hypothetical protein
MFFSPPAPRKQSRPLRRCIHESTAAPGYQDLPAALGRRGGVGEMTTTEALGLRSSQVDRDITPSFSPDEPMTSMLASVEKFVPDWPSFRNELTMCDAA